MNLDNDLHDPDEREREISLGTSTIVGIFLVLALVCAAFFGFGYSLGRHSNQANASSVPEARQDSSFSNFKSAAPPAKTTANPQVEEQNTDEQITPQEVVKKDARKANESQPAHNVTFPVPSQRAAPAGEAPPAASQSALPAGQFVVQVSAPSRQGDADALIAALGRKGYKAFIRKEPQDSFFHVQIGPFASKKDAQALLQQLDADGYKPFIK